MSQCHLCGHESEYAAGYCIQCGVNLNGGATPTSPEWATTEEFLDLSKALSSTMDLHLLLKKIDDSAVKLTKATAGAIMLFDETRTSLRFRNSSSVKSTIVKSLPVTDGIAWWVGQHGLKAKVDDAPKDRRFTGAIDKITGHRTKNLICMPVFLEDEIIGVIEVLNKINGAEFTEQDEQLLSVLVGQATVAVKNVRLASEQRNFFDHVIEMLVSAIESTLLVPKKHCWRVAKMATAVGRKLGMQDQSLQNLYYGAVLHDLGILRLRNNGIAKESLMKTHPILGANMIRDIDMLHGAELIIRCHHEYLDGSGYPDGLIDEEIPLEAKIVAVVEIFEEVSLKLGSSLKAGACIRKDAGKLFDATVANTFLKLMKL